MTNSLMDWTRNRRVILLEGNFKLGNWTLKNVISHSCINGFWKVAVASTLTNLWWLVQPVEIAVVNKNFFPKSPHLYSGFAHRWSGKEYFIYKFYSTSSYCSVITERDGPSLSWFDPTSVELRQNKTFIGQPTDRATALRQAHKTITRLNIRPGMGKLCTLSANCTFYRALVVT